MVTKRKPKRSKAFSFLMFPLFIFIFTSGWLISWIDGHNSSLETQETQEKQNNAQPEDYVTIGMIPLETEITA
jgi:hypothetical protein